MGNWHPTNSTASQEPEDHLTRLPLNSHWIYRQCAGLLRRDLKEKQMASQSGFTSTLREGQSPKHPSADDCTWVSWPKMQPHPCHLAMLIYLQAHTIYIKPNIHKLQQVFATFRKEASSLQTPLLSVYIFFLRAQLGDCMLPHTIRTWISSLTAS